MSRTIRIPCAKCGKQFDVDQWRHKNKGARFCSRQCGNRVHPPALERFLINVNKNGPNGCWLWTGAINTPRGYANFYENGRVILGHRWAQKHFNGPIQKGQYVMHSCDTPACVNPAHLSAVAPSVNSQDYLKKGRKSTATAPDKIRAIAERLKGQPFKWEVYVPIAKDFGLSPSTIYAIHVGRTWRYITGFPRTLRGVSAFMQQAQDDKQGEKNG